MQPALENTDTEGVKIISWMIDPDAAWEENRAPLRRSSRRTSIVSRFFMLGAMDSAWGDSVPGYYKV